MTFVEDTALLRKEVSPSFPFALLTVTTDRTSEVCGVRLVTLYLEPVQPVRDDPGVLTIDPLTHYITIH